jgi:aminopeptidase N
MRLELDIPDMQEQRILAQETLSLEAIGSPRDHIMLDAVGMEIESVDMSGQPVPYEHDGRDLRVTFMPPIEPGQRVDLTMRYTLDSTARNGGGLVGGGGLTWSEGKPDARSESRRSPQIHSQGQAEDNSRWFICHDFPNERLTTEIIVTVEDGYMTSSNGRLVDRHRTEDGRIRWHWIQDKPHVNYLVTLVVGKFEVVNVGGRESARPGLPMPVYAPIGKGDDAKEAFANTPEMIATFEELFDEPYPWDRYAQVLVRGFGGGMENTSATTLGEWAARGRRGSQDGLISHELAHQWFGDLITCKSWEHIWLNEGWATYCEALWREHTGGRKSYLNRIRGALRQSGGASMTYAPAYEAMASKRYANPDASFYRENNPYSKGALVLHMLRSRLGDEVFFKAVAEYVDRYKFDVAETDDFRRVLEDVSGQSLERFFDQWVYRPGLPKLSVDLTYDSAEARLGVVVEQTQKIDKMNPAYAFTLPLYVELSDGTYQYVYVPMETRRVETSFELTGEPMDVTIDPNLRVAALTKIRTPLTYEIDADEVEAEPVSEEQNEPTDSDSAK